MTHRNRGFVQMFEPVTLNATHERGTIIEVSMGAKPFLILLDDGKIVRAFKNDFMRLRNRLRNFCDFGYSKRDHRVGICHYLHVGNKLLKSWYE